MGLVVLGVAAAGVLATRAVFAVELDRVADELEDETALNRAQHQFILDLQRENALLEQELEQLERK